MQNVNYSEAVSKTKEFFFKNEKVNYLDKPSIIFEDELFNFLSLSFNTSRELTVKYYSSQKKLYFSTLKEFDQVFKYIDNLFNEKEFSLLGFKKQNKLFSSYDDHFISNQFEFSFDKKAQINYILKTSGFAIVLSIFFIINIVLSPWIPWDSKNGAVLFIALILILSYSGMTIRHLYKYYQFSKNKKLIISKGNDTFYFGDKSNLSVYNKKEISEYIVYEISNKRRMLSGFAVINIKFHDGTSIIVPNTLITIKKLKNKLTECKAVEINLVPDILGENLINT